MVSIFIVIALCLFTKIQGASLGVKDGNIDPGIITWPQETWYSTPFQVYQTSPSFTATGFKISFRPSATIPNGVLQIFVGQSLGMFSMNIIGNHDNSIIVTLNSLCYSGADRMPIGIATRSSATGQIYDANYAFAFSNQDCSFYVNPGFSIQTAGNSNSNRIGSPIDLFFIIDLTIPLWKYDIIEIRPDAFWGISPNVTCSSVNPLLKENFLYGISGDRNLPCVKASGSNPWNSIFTDSHGSSASSVYIYGINDVYQTQWRATIRVSSFILPLFTAKSSSWSIYIWRWGTSILKWYYSIYLNLDILPGLINLKEWKPISSIPKNEIAEGSTIFTKLTFETTHEIPKTGKIIISFKNADIQTPRWWQDLSGDNAASGQCYLNSYIKGASCTISNSTTAIINLGNANQPAGVFEITFLATISVEAKVVSIVSTNYYVTNMYDSSSDYLLWPVNVTNSAMKTLKSHIYNTNKYPNIDSYFSKGTYTSGLQIGAILNTNNYLFFLSQPGVLNQWNETTMLKIFIPFSDSSVQLTQTYIGSSAEEYYVCDDLTGSSSVSVNTYNDTNKNYHKRNPGNSGEITVFFNNIDPGCIPFSNQYYIFGFKTPSNFSTGIISLPMVQSNLATFYEIWAKAVTGRLVDIGSYVFTVMKTTPVNTSQLRTIPICMDRTSRIPLYHLFTPLYANFDFTSTEILFQIQIDISPSIFKGIDIGKSIPIYSNSTSTPTATKIGDRNMIITGLGNLTANSSPVEVYIPNYSNFAGSFYSYTSFFYVTPKDPSTKMMIFDSSISNSFTEITKFGAKPEVFESFEVGGSGSLSITNLVLQSGKLSSGAGDYIGIILPQGFDAISETLILGEVECGNLLRISSAGDYFDGLFIIINGTDSAFLSNSTAKTLTILGLQAAHLVVGHSPTPTPMGMFLVNSKNFGAGKACDASYSFSVYLSPGTILYDSCQPLSIPVRGPDSIDITMIITFNTTHNIPENGVIHASLDSSWTFTDPNSCYSPDLSDYNSTVHVSCTINIITGELEITGFSSVSPGIINVVINHTLPPKSIGSGTTTCAQVIYTLDSYGNYIDYKAHLNQNVILTESLPIGKTSDLKAFAYPNIPGKVADISLTFSLTRTLPVGSVINVSCGFSRWLDALIWIQDICYASFDYLSCKYIDGTIQLINNVKIPADTQIEIYIDNSLVLPSNSGQTSSGFQISTYWNNVLITADSAPGFVFYVDAKVDLQVTLSSIAFNGFTNTGHLSSYYYNFTSSAPVDAGDYFIIQFPKAYNPYIGEITYSDCSPNLWYLPCSSASLINVTCNPDHWYLKISGINAHKNANEVIDIRIDKILNPLSSTYKFNIFHHSSKGLIKAYGYPNYALAIEYLPSTMSLKNVSLDNPTIGAMTSYYFKLSGFYCCGNTFLVIFPSAYSLDRTKIACSYMFYAESDELNSHSWIDIDCSWNKTSIKLYFSSFVKSNNILVIRIQGIRNPEWGYKRDGGWDIQYKSIFGDYSLWSDLFSVLIFGGDQTTSISQRSYTYTNPAYVGFKLNGTTIRINEDIDKPPKVIKALPGLQSKDLTVLVPLTWPLKSKSLVLTPSVSFNNSTTSKVSCSSAFHDWTLKQMSSSMVFRISVLSEASPGYYYIDWSISEVSQEGVSNSIYQVTSQTVVEVCNTTSSVITIEIASIPALFVGYTSIPIAVKIPNSPATDMTINLSINPASSGISLTPSSLTFNPDINILYFQIDVTSSYNSAQASPTLSFTLEGTDSSLFISPPPITLKISSNLATTSPEFSISYEVLHGSQAIFNITPIQNGVFYWSISCLTSNFIPTFNDLRSLCADLVAKSDSTLSLREQLMRDYRETEIDIDESKGDTDAYSFFRRVYKEHCSQKWYSSEVIYANKTISINLNWLMEGTWYTFVSYFDNRLGKNPQKIINFTTPSTSEISIISVNFDTNELTLDQGESIRFAVAKNMGINPLWLSNEKINIDSSSTKFSYEILYDRSNSLYSSIDILKNLNKDQAQIDIISALGSTPTFNDDKIQTPAWVFPIVLSNINPQNATFIAASTTNGKICTSCSKTLSQNPTYAWQVINKLDSNFIEVPGICNTVSANTNVSIIVTGLSEWNTYYCYFTACSDFSLWNLCMDYEDNSPLQELVISTTNTSFNGSIDCADTHCQVCSAQGQCLQCFPPTYYLDSSSKCSLCGSGKYSDGIQCYSCSNSECSVCSGPSQCSKCYDPTLHPDTTGQCTFCPDGQFSNNDGSLCLSCSDNCKTCTDTSNFCTSCYSGFLFNNTCLHSCPAGYYYSNIIGTCDKCNYICKECIYANTNCTACYSGFIHYPNTCKLACAKGTYYDGLQCQPCSTNCATCSEKSNNCTSCAGYYKYSYENSCFNVCPPDITIASGYTCKACISPCATCKGISTNCTSCISPYSLYQGNCVDACPQYYSSVSLSGVATCVPPCPQGKILNSVGTCDSCGTSCAACSGKATYCTKCSDANLYAYQGSCISSCPKDITVAVNSQCQKCSSSCLTCSVAYNNCTSCPADTYLWVNQCVTTCPDGYMSSIQNGINICLQCDSSCETCAEAINKCTSCKLGSYKLADTCYKCGTMCASCSSSMECDYCKDPATQTVDLVNDLGNCICVGATYYNGVTCQNCGEYCLSCNSTRCNKCIFDFMGVDITNPLGCTCVRGYYDGSTCQSCGEHCAACNKDQCTRCSQSSMIINSDNKKNCICQTGYYYSLDNDKCLPCNSKCAICSSFNNCSKCSQTNGMIISIKNPGTCECDSGWIDHGNVCSNCTNTQYWSGYECLNCTGLCSACSSSKDCISCKPHSSLTNNTCICDDGFIQGGSQCLACPELCSVCTSPTTCSTCRSNAILGSDKKCHCNAGFQANSSGYCTAICDYYCQTCDENNGKKCFSCIPNAELVNDSCYCTANSYYEPSSNSCLCQLGYNLAFGKCVLCKKYLLTSEIYSSYFESNFASIYIDFSVTLDTTLDSSCSKILTSYSYLKMGKNPGCSWNGTNSIKILLGASFTQWDDMIYLDGTYLLKRTSDQCTTNYQPLYTSPKIPQNPYPVAVLTGPKDVSLACGTAFNYSTDLSTGNLGMPFTYTWSSSIVPEIQGLRLSIASNNASNILISKSWFTPDVTYSVTLNATLTNYQHYSSWAVLTIKFMWASSLAIQFDQGDNITVKSSDAVSVKAKVASTCGDSTIPIQWAWALIYPKLQINWTVVSDKLSISPNTLKAGTKYLIKAYASQTTGGLSVRGEASIYINVNYSPLYITLSRGGGDISPNQDFYIDAKGSYDPDDPTSTLVYSWICRNHTDGSDCKGPDGNSLISNEIYSSLTIPSSRFIIGSYWDITCAIYKNNRNATMTVAIHVLENPTKTLLAIPASSLKVSSQTVSYTADVTSDPGAELLWTQTSGQNITISPDYLPRLTIPAGTMSDGEIYTFQLAVNDGSVTSTAQLTIEVNAGAMCTGSTEINPGEGIALVDLFTVSISGCYDRDGDDYPLIYTFHDNWNDKLYTLGYTSQSSKVITYLFAGYNTLSSNVCDQLSGCSDYSLVVNIWETDNKRYLLSDSLTDAYLRNTLDQDNIPSTIVLFCSSVEIDESLFSQMWNDTELYIDSNIMSNNLLSGLLEALYAMSNQQKQMNITIYNKFFNMLDNVLLNNTSIIPSNNDLINVVALGDNYRIFGNYTGYEDQSLEDFIIAADNLYHSWMTRATKPDLPSQSSITDSQNTPNTIIFKSRDFPNKMLNKAIQLGNDRKIVFPSKLSFNDTSILNLWIKYYKTSHNDYSDIVSLKLTQSGTYNNFTINITDEFDISFHTSSHPFEVELPINRNKSKGEIWTCNYYDEKQEEWKESHCSVIDVKNSSIVIEVYHFSMFKISAKFPKHHNYAPIFIVTGVISLFVLFILIMAIYNKLHKAPLKIEKSPDLYINSEAVVKIDEQEQRAPVNSICVEPQHESAEDPSSPRIDSIQISISGSLPNIEEKPIKIEEKNLRSFNALLERHLAFGLFFASENNVLRILRMFTLAEIILLEFVIEGIFFKSFVETDNRTDKSTTELFVEYEIIYFVYTIIAIIVTLPIEIFETRILLFDGQKTNKRVIFAIIVEILVFVGSIAGVFIFNSSFDHDLNGYWTISFLWGILIELFITQPVLMCLNYYFYIKEAKLRVDDKECKGFLQNK